MLCQRRNSSPSVLLSSYGYALLLGNPALEHWPNLKLVWLETVALDKLKANAFSCLIVVCTEADPRSFPCAVCRSMTNGVLEFYGLAVGECCAENMLHGRLPYAAI
jgi:hypothetical protein